MVHRNFISFAIMSAHQGSFYTDNGQRIKLFNCLPYSKEGRRVRNFFLTLFFNLCLFYKKFLQNIFFMSTIKSSENPLLTFCKDIP